MPLTNEKEKRPINHGLCEKKKKISLWPWPKLYKC
jgi:hypothetical protein